MTGNGNDGRSRSAGTISAIVIAVLTLLSSPVWGPPICAAVGLCDRKTDDSSGSNTTSTPPSSPGKSPSASPAVSLSHSYNSAQQVWQVVEGNRSLLAYKREADANDARAVAKRFRQHCFVGRDNKRPERYRFVMDYWREPSGITTTIASPDCIRFNAGNLSIVDLGAATTAPTA